jgi:plastocyanin
MKFWEKKRMFQFLTKNKNRQDARCKMQDARYNIFFASCFLLLTSYFLPVFLYAEEMLKTSKVKVGEKAPLTDSLKKPHEDGKAIVLLLLSNPMQCENCEKVSQLIKEEIEKYKDNVDYIAKGGLDIRGAVDEETVALKKLYGFITMGQPWTFIIDKQGILQKMYFGAVSRNELNDAIKLVIEKKLGQGFSPANVKEFIFVVTEGNIELDGTKFSVWTYNGTVPGPEIRVKEGDTVRVKLQNKSGAKHGIFFHGLHVPPKVAMQEEVPVDPGYEYTYEFIAKPSGTHLYHCSYNMAEHLTRGLYGAFIVEAKPVPAGSKQGDEPKSDKEFVYILSDWNSKTEKGEDHHGAGHPRSMLDNDITTINERAVTGDNPIIMEAKKGERIRIRLANIGHLPHTLRFADGFLVTHEDGYPIPQPKTQDSLTIYPGKRHDIVVTAGNPGKATFYHSVNMPKSAGERLQELESPKKKSDERKHEHTKVSHDSSHDEHKPASEGFNREKDKIRADKELPILVLDVRGGGGK